MKLKMIIGALAGLGLVLGAAGPVAAACQMVKQAELDVRFSANRPLVQASINGKPVWLLVDTGAVTSLLFAGPASRLGLQGYDTGATFIGVGGEVAVHRARIAEFALQKALVKDFEINIAGGSNITGRGAAGDDERQVVGVLGRDFLGLVDVEFDLAQGKMRLFTPRDCGRRSLAYWSDGASYVDMDRNGYKLAPFNFPLKLNGYQVNAMLDSGAGITVVTPSIAVHAGVSDDHFAKETGRAAGIGVRIVETRTATFDTVDLGDEKIKKAELRVSELVRSDEGGSAGTHIGQGGLSMLLGADFLRSHRVLISTNQDRIYFTYTGGAVFNQVGSAEPAATPERPKE